MEELQTVWGWQPAVYLFLGGMGAGAFLVAGILYLKDGDRNRVTICVSMWTALACLGIGLGLLLSELIFPLRGLLLWQSFSNGSSWMMFGAWAAFAAMVLYLVSAVLMTGTLDAVIHGRRPAAKASRSALAKAIVIAGMVLSMCVAVYTGMLLMSAPGVPLWSFWLLPCLFTVSALDTGIALVEIVSVAVARKEQLTHDATVLLERAVVVLVSVEIVVLLAYVTVALSGDAESAAAVATTSMKMLVSGTLAPAFWVLLVGCGLALPLAMALYSLIKRNNRAMLPLIIGASGAVVGGCALRFLILLAGQHANLVSDTLALLPL